MSKQGKNKRRQITCFDAVHSCWLSVDSQEEADMLQWLSEAHNLSVIKDFLYQPPPFLLSEAVKQVDADGKERTLLREHIYTPDWLVAIQPSSQSSLAKEFKVPRSNMSCQECSVHIDCKGMYNSTERAFGYNQKWVWQRFKVYVCKLVPKMFFKKFGVPKGCTLTSKSKKPRKMFEGFKLLADVFKRA